MWSLLSSNGATRGNNEPNNTSLTIFESTYWERKKKQRTRYTNQMRPNNISQFQKRSRPTTTNLQLQPNTNNYNAIIEKTIKLAIENHQEISLHFEFKLNSHFLARCNFSNGTYIYPPTTAYIYSFLLDCPFLCKQIQIFTHFTRLILWASSSFSLTCSLDLPFTRSLAFLLALGHGSANMQ